MNLELMAMVWLRVEKRCEIVLCERSPRSWFCGQPDVLGITKGRHMVEIEVKRTMSDFRADSRKRSRVNRRHYLDMQPRQFYYLAPAEVAAKIQPGLPEWAGLMHAAGRYPEVIVRAPVNKVARKLTVKECCRLVPMLTNHILASETSRDNLVSNWFTKYEPRPLPTANLIDYANCSESDDCNPVGA